MKNLSTELKILIGILTVAVVVLSAMVLYQKAPDIFLGDRTNTTVKSTDASETNLYGGPAGSALSNASGITVTAGASGSLPAGTYYLKITSTDYSGGQTAPTSELTCSPTVTATGSCTVALTLNARASTTRIWVATSTGVYYGYQSATSSSLIATTTGLTAGTIPTTNTAFNDIGIARYNQNGITLTDGYLSNLQVDANGNLKTTEATLGAGEDLTNDVLKVENRYNYSYTAAATANIVVTASAGFLHAMCVGTASSTLTETIEISDHASDGDGAVKFFFTDPPVGCYTIDAVFGTGISADTIGATNITFIYR